MNKRIPTNSYLNEKAKHYVSEHSTLEDMIDAAYRAGYQARCFEAHYEDDAMWQAIDSQMQWSADTFGPGPRTNHVLDHLSKEVEEARAKPADLEEWIDIMILAADGAWRGAGATAQEIIDAYKAKLYKNFQRKWPDWRLSPDKAIEHIRDDEEPGPTREELMSALHEAEARATEGLPMIFRQKSGE